MSDAPPADVSHRRPWKAWAFWAAVALAYAAVVVVGSRWRGSWDPTSQFPATVEDPLQHLWIARWYKDCLLEGRSPLICPEVDYPVGSPIGNFSPMHLQALLYLPLSMVTGNDVLTYNILWLIGLVLTGVGTFALARYVTGDIACAGFAGLAAMLSGPMMGRACGHLELMYVGSFPLFLLGWIRFVDRPTRGRAVAAAALLTFVALSAAYFLVYAVFPAGLYLGWAALSARRRGEAGWLRARVRPMLGFVAVAVPMLVLIFAGHIWARLHGLSPGRSEEEFRRAASPLWSYVVPMTGYRFEPFFPANPYRTPGVQGGPRATSSYLGVATLALLAYGAIRRPRFARASFWWAALAMLVVLGLGASWEVAGATIPLPAAWLRWWFYPFRLIREVDRFNLFAVVVASVLAAVALRHAVRRLPNAPTRALVVAGVMALAMVDLSRVFWGTTPPAMPACYELIHRVDPLATFLEVHDDRLKQAVGYWQSLHRLPSSVTFSGLENPRYNSRIRLNSPFGAHRVTDPAFLRDGDLASFDFLSTAHFRDYAWLFLHANDYRYVVVHKQALEGRWDAPGLARVDALLADARVYEDERTVVYARDRIGPPERPVILSLDGWTLAWTDHLTRLAGKSARLVAYNPDPDRPLTFRLDARASLQPRRIRLILNDGAGGRELARWRVGSDADGRYESPPLNLPAGLVALTLEGDGEARLPIRIDPVDPGPFTAKVAGMGLEPAPEPVASAGAPARR